MSPFNLRLRRERRERLRSVKGDGSRSLHQVRRSVKDGSGSLHRLRRSGRGRSRGKRRCSVADISLKKRALLSHLRRQRGLKAPVTAGHESPATTSEEYPPQDSTSEYWTPPLAEESFSSRVLSDPWIRWTEEEEETDLGVDGKHKRKFKVGSVFDPESNSWVVKYDLAVDPLPPWSTGIRRSIECGVCGQPGHLEIGCSLMFDYPPDSPPFNTEDFQVVCECGSNEIVPGRRSCIHCPPNSRLHVDSKYPPPLLEFEDENPDPASYCPIFPDSEYEGLEDPDPASYSPDLW